MQDIISFIRDCGVFFVLTVDNNAPAGRPFGAIMENEGFLYIATADVKPVYQQLKTHKKMQILALKPGTRQWIRVNGIAEECNEVFIKRKMLEECPVLSKHYASAEAEHYNVFRISVDNCEFH